MIFVTMKKAKLKLSRFAIPILFILGNILYLAVVEDIRHKLDPAAPATAIHKMPSVKDSLNPLPGPGPVLVSADAAIDGPRNKYENTVAK